jgi:hypothetical protein
MFRCPDTASVEGEIVQCRLEAGHEQAHEGIDPKRDQWLWSWPMTTPANVLDARRRLNLAAMDLALKGPPAGPVPPPDRVLTPVEIETEWRRRRG